MDVQYTVWKQGSSLMEDTDLHFPNREMKSRSEKMWLLRQSHRCLLACSCGEIWWGVGFWLLGWVFFFKIKVYSLHVCELYSKTRMMTLRDSAKAWICQELLERGHKCRTQTRRQMTVNRFIYRNYRSMGGPGWGDGQPAWLAEVARRMS